MRSSASREALSLDRDLPTTTNDVIVLRRLRHAQRISLEDYLRFLSGFDPLPPSVLRRRKGPAGSPFDLVR